MRFMMMIYPDAMAEAGVMPDVETVSAMMKYNEELAKAGALISLDGLHPSSKGARIAFAGGKTTVTDGPFTETNEVLGGYWIIQVKTRDEAIEWARRVPPSHTLKIELRQVFEMSDFPADVQEAADNPMVRAQVDLHA